jgi:hypothetical protein
VRNQVYIQVPPREDTTLEHRDSSDSSNISDRSQHCMHEVTADPSGAVPPTVRHRIFCLPVCYLNTSESICTEL